MELVGEYDILDYKELGGKIRPSPRLTKNDYFFQTQFLLSFSFQTHKEKMKTDTLTHTEKSQQLSEGNISFPLYISHPVSKKKKIVYRTEQTIFIIGETPKGIRRYIYKNTGLWELFTKEIQLLNKIHKLFEF